MPEKLDLTTNEIPDAINGAVTRGHAVVLGYIDDAGDPAVSFRGSTLVHGPQQLAIWARKRDAGFAKAIEGHPRVSLLYFGGSGPGPRFLTFKGTAHVDESASDAVYSTMVEGERAQDPERNGVAVIVEVESVFGVGANGPFQMARAAE